MTLPKFTFNSKEPGGLETARQVVFRRLREEPTWNQVPNDPRQFDRYVDYVGAFAPDRFGILLLDVFWELIIQGVIAPGLHVGTPDFPWFHLTEYGQKVPEADKYIPHYPTGYLANLATTISNPDHTVMAYLGESQSRLLHKRSLDRRKHSLGRCG